MKITAKYDDDGDLHLCVDDEIDEIIEEGVFSIVPSDDFVNAVAKLFQTLIDKRDGTTSTEPSDKAHSHAGYVAREFAKRISAIPEGVVVEMVIEEELQKLVKEELV